MKKINSDFSSEWVMNELVKGNWTKQYAFDEKAPFYFKFNDQKNFIKKVQYKLKENSTFHNIYDLQSKFIKELASVKLWLKHENNIMEMNLLDVYTGLIKHLKDSSFEDQLFNANEVSFLGPLGPFKFMPLVECLNDDITEKLIFTQILKNKLPSRKMRICTQGKVKIEYGESFDKSAHLSIRQITDSGILFSCTDDHFLGQMQKNEFLKFYIDTTSLKQFIDNDLNLNQTPPKEFFYTEDHLRYFFIEEKNVVKSLSYNSGTSSEIYLFTRYFHMLESDVPTIFNEFTDKVDELFKKVG